jgi:hypothetical protein
MKAMQFMMSKLRYFLVLSLITVTFVLNSCFKPTVYPDEPSIEYKDFVIKGDSAILSINFIDGDGDIGIDPTNLDSPFDTASFYHYNLYLEYYEKMEGEWVKGTIDPSGNNFPTGDTINFAFRIKNLTPTGQNKTLKGVINVTLEPIFYNPISNHNDSIMFRVSLFDRKLNRSNFIETPLIVK